MTLFGVTGSSEVACCSPFIPRVLRVHVKLFAQLFLLLTVWSHFIGFQESVPMAIHYVHRIESEQL